MEEGNGKEKMNEKKKCLIAETINAKNARGNIKKKILFHI